MLTRPGGYLSTPRLAHDTAQDGPDPRPPAAQGPALRGPVQGSEVCKTHEHLGIRS